MNTIKQKHIELENKLFSTEKLCALAKLNGLYTWNKDAFQKAEKALSSIAFHDILSGTCGPDGEKSALRKADCALELLNEEFNKAFFSICSQQLKAGNGEFPIFVYNPMPYKRKTVCEVEFLSTKTISDVDAQENIVTVRKDGEIVPSQCVHELTNINYDRRKRIAFLGE
jgi:alpha-mannosidase